MNARPAGAAIAGLGMTELGKVFGRSPRRLAAEAVRLAVADAGLALAEIDGLLVCPGISGQPGIGLARGEHLAAIAVSQRQWAAGNPRAEQQEPITIADHQASRCIAEPLHLLDCCLVSNGGIAVVVTTAERAAGLHRPWR